MVGGKEWMGRRLSGCSGALQARASHMETGIEFNLEPNRLTGDQTEGREWVKETTGVRLANRASHSSDAPRSLKPASAAAASSFTNGCVSQLLLLAS